jgi:hypothetical protein
MYRRKSGSKPDAMASASMSAAVIIAGKVAANIAGAAIVAAVGQ